MRILLMLYNSDSRNASVKPISQMKAWDSHVAQWYRAAKNAYKMVSFGAVTEFGGWDLVVFVFLIYVIYVVFLKKPVKDLRRDEEEDNRINRLPPMPKRDFTVEQLLLFDGVQNERILMAVCGKVFDVTKGRLFYGPEGAYGKLAGHDATRALSKMDLTLVKDTPDDLSDISESDLNTAREWMQSFIYKYPIVGKLLAEGEEPTNYSEEEALS